MENTGKRKLESYKGLRIGDSVTNGFDKNKVIKEFYTNPFDFTFLVFEGEGEEPKTDEWHMARNGWRREIKPAVYRKPEPKVGPVVPMVTQMDKKVSSEDDEHEEVEEPVLVVVAKEPAKVYNNDITKRQLLEI